MHIKSKLHATTLAAFAAMSSVAAHANITIETVTVGNPGNAVDTTGYGAVAYTYQIGKYEVTNAQYAAFLNDVAATDTYGLYSTSMGSSPLGGITRSGSSGTYRYATKDGFMNKPVNYVSFWDATRFANWLNNGQGSVSTEAGSYVLSGTGISGNTVTRNVGAGWVVASENEWYKAAYYDPTKNGEAGGYWLLPTQSDILGQNSPFEALNSANFYDGDYANGGFSGPGMTDVGSYANSASYFGTFDQGGNVWEWNEEIIGDANRRARGGGLGDSGSALRSSNRTTSAPNGEASFLGFRVVNLASIPEPGTYSAAMGGMALAGAMLSRRERSIFRR